LKSIVKNCPNVETLDLSFWPNISHDSLLHISTLPLTEIFLGRCINLTNLGVILIGKTWKKTLRRIYLAGCSKITDESIIFLINSCAQLEVLSLPGTSITGILITINLDSTIYAAGKLSKTLKVAQFSFCNDITPYAVGKLAYTCPKLTIIQLVNCPKILKSFVIHYSIKCPTHLKERYRNSYCAIRKPQIREMGLEWKNKWFK
jgi:hypothetical protein